MQIICQSGLLRTIALMAFLWGMLPNGSLYAQSQPSNPKRKLDIPRQAPTPPTIPTIRRGGNCSTVTPEVLVPTSDKQIATTSTHPTILFFVPTTTARQAQFILKDSDRKSIYRQSFALSGKSGIFRLELPTDRFGELAVGQVYKWEFNIICVADRPVDDDFVVGKLQRVSLSVESKSPLSQVSLWERYRAFEYDGLMVLDALRRANSTEQKIQDEWESWLERHKLGDLKQLPAIKLK